MIINGAEPDTPQISVALLAAHSYRSGARCGHTDPNGESLVCSLEQYHDGPHMAWPAHLIMHDGGAATGCWPNEALNNA